VKPSSHGRDLKKRSADLLEVGLLSLAEDQYVQVGVAPENAREGLRDGLQDNGRGLAPNTKCHFIRIGDSVVDPCEIGTSHEDSRSELFRKHSFELAFRGTVLLAKEPNAGLAPLVNSPLLLEQSEHEVRRIRILRGK
jgi:hypothetical protein